MTHDDPDRFTGSRLPILAALATHTARPSALGRLLLGVGVLGALGWVTIDGRHRFGIAMVFEALVGLLVTLIAPMLSAQQLFIDRQNGALDQQRLAGRSPREMLAAYVLGPSWALIAFLWAVAIATVSVASPAERHIGLGVALAATVVGLAWSVGGVALSLGMDRSVPLNQAGSVGLLAPFARVPLYGLVFGAARERAWAPLVAFELFALALSLRFALRRLARDEEDFDRSSTPAAAVAASAVVAATIAGADMLADPRALALSVSAAVTLPLMAAWAVSPSRGAAFRAWVTDAPGTARRLRGTYLLAAVLAGPAVIGGRLVAAGGVELQTIAAALFASAMVAALLSLRTLRAAGFSPRALNILLLAALAIPAGSWISSRLAPLSSVGRDPILAALGAPFAPVVGVGGFAARALLCGAVLVLAAGGHAWALRRMAARAEALAA